MRGTNNRTIAAVKTLFRKAAKLLSGRDEDEPRPATRRRGETEGDRRTPAARPALAAAARGRYAILKPAQATPLPDAYAEAGLYLADTIEWLNLWGSNAANEQWQDDNFNVKQDYYYPQP